MTDNIKTETSHVANIIILQGGDRLSIEEEIAAVINEVGQDGFSQLNTSRLDGSVINFNEISMQLNFLPLGGMKRVVILDNAVEAIGKKGASDWLKGILSNFSPSTLLVLILEDKKKYKNGSMVWEVFGPEHWLRKIINQFSGGTRWVEFPLPSYREMPDWIIKEAKKQDGNFHPQAAVQLSKLIGNDLFQARREIEKAIFYAGDDKQVSADIVRLLCPSTKEESVFDLVDAVGQRNGKLAFKLLHEMSTESPIQYIFTMLVRQVRLLIITKEVLLHGGSERDVMAACRLHHTFIIKKLINQARRFNIENLEDFYRSLDHLDEDSKIGRENLDAALDRLVAYITVI